MVTYSYIFSQGNDDIYICGKNAADLIEVQHAFSTGRTTPIPKPLVLRMFSANTISFHYEKYE